MDDQLHHRVGRPARGPLPPRRRGPAGRTPNCRNCPPGSTGPLRLAIAGKIKAGKSTLLNALVGEELAPTDAGECTRIVTWYQRGDQPQVTDPPAAADRRRPRTSPGRAARSRSNSAAAPADDVDRLEVSWPTNRLAEITLIDTPGIASISTDLSARTLRVLTPEDDRPPVVDAVLYLLRHTHASDVRFLESFHDDDLAHGTPMNAVGVLSRADEIGSCRLDALEVAERVGQRYQSEPRLRRLCPVIVPVAGLLGPCRGHPARTGVSGAGHARPRAAIRRPTSCC